VSDEKDIQIFFEQGGSFLDPGSVGSSIQWFVRVHTYEISHGKHKGKRSSQLQGCVNLTDCERRISWGLWDVKKIDAAIEELKKVRRATIKAKRLYEKHKFKADEYEE